MKFLLLTVLFVAFAANSAIEFDRECRSLPVVEDFDMQKYAGNWYEVMRYDSSLQKNGDCSTFDYAYDFELEMVMDLNVTHHWRYLANGTSVYRYGVLSYMGDHPHVDRHHHNEGHLELTFNDDPRNPIHYCLVASDYENYALVWACETLPNGRSNEDAWVLSKAGELVPEALPIIQPLIDEFLYEGTMKPTHQGPDCLGISPL